MYTFLANILQVHLWKVLCYTSIQLYTLPGRRPGSIFLDMGGVGTVLKKINNKDINTKLDNSAFFQTQTKKSRSITLHIYQV